MADKDAIALLKQDHRDAKELFKEFEKAKGDGRKEKLAHEICLALSVHFQLTLDGLLEFDSHRLPPFGFYRTAQQQVT